MTHFNKADFSYHGGYLMYRGAYEGQPVYEAGKNVHPSNVGRGIDLFIARFKYAGSPITKAKFLKELVNSFTVEQYVEACKTESPLTVLMENNQNWYNNIMSAWKTKNNIGEAHV